MKKSLSILLIIKSLPWKFKGGIQTHTWDLARALHEKGHHVTILTGGAFLKSSQKEIKDEIEIREIPFFPGRYLPLISYLAEEWAFNFAAKNWVKKNHSRYEIIHAQGRSGYLLYQIEEIKNKLVQTLHGLTSLEAQSGKNFNAWTHANVVQHWERKMVNTAALSIAVSEDLKNKISGVSGNPLIEVIPNGINGLETVLTSSDQTVDRFVFVGRLHPVKGLMPILEEIAKSEEKIYLDIIGSGPQEKEIQSKIQSLELQAQVRMFGERDNDVIKYLLPYYRGLLLPSVYESQGIVLLEANLAGIPVVASDLSAIRESISQGKNGFLCDPKSPESFVSAMAFLKNNPLLARKMGEFGRENVLENYTWEKIASQTEDCYYKIAG
ncbi:glycosyltransferase family 1 protein [Algoriphagus kandeliae]|uniref:Glycosyltransferase family 1 protein n=1 Tax=Algoriphagus kandeliae TaxID=2562278 RepID=A0A4Y9QX98_9BACT|nr:glycosyltransferase family 4 protein [Algoriphagus kandeliae]TFV95585.1 glycosyltransferase family 1 protein [Algoriphagus kandeliae]